MKPLSHTYSFRHTPSLTCDRDVDDIHDMMDDITEQNEIAEEISTALSAPIGFGEVDEVSEQCTLLGSSETF